MLRIITSACNQRLQLGLKGIICSRIVNFINYRSEALRSLSSICCKRKLRPQNQTICQRQCHNDTRSAIQLMDFPVIFRPSLVYSLKNVWMSALIRSFDQTFSANSFLGQAQQVSFLKSPLLWWFFSQAVYVVSNLIADGEFEKLHGLVTEKVYLWNCRYFYSFVTQALYEIESNHARLNDEQRNFIRIKEGTIHVKYLYQIGMIMDMPGECNIVLAFN